MIEPVVFIIAGACCVAGALGVVFIREPVHAALSLVGSLFGVAVIFVVAEANFLAAVQVIVYAGAVVVLFLFVIMLLGVDTLEELGDDPLKVQRPAAAIFALGGLGVAVWMAASGAFSLTGEPAQLDEATADLPDVQRLAHSLFGDFVFAFELTSALLVIAVLGAVVLARRGHLDEEVDA
jgi:NADH-quinone oxidoreductase subunit J